MRGRKQMSGGRNVSRQTEIKKESPNEGTETRFRRDSRTGQPFIKKESPNEGTETHELSNISFCHLL